MKAVDTNVVLRALLADDPVQTPIAERIISAGVFVPLTVLLEVAWVLRSNIGLNRAEIATVLREFVEMPEIQTANDDLMGIALSNFASGSDLEDVIHLVASHGKEAFVTFDKGVPDDPAFGVTVEQV